MDIAILADIHGNRWALEAVLEDIERHDTPLVVDLGDSLLGPFDPAGTAELLIRRAIPSIRGNNDRDILDATTRGTPTLRLADEMLRPGERAWLAALPATRVLFDEILLCHGTPHSDRVFLLERPARDGPLLRPSGEIADELAGVRQTLIACGHSHIPRLVALPDGRAIVNPGSVGIQAFTDDLSAPYAMETGSPHARYASLTNGARGWHVTFHAIPYDWEQAARAAEEISGPEYAGWVRTGRV